MKFEAVLFDLDGTLLDSLELIVDSYLYTMRAHDLPPRTREGVLGRIGKTLEATFGEWVAGHQRHDIQALTDTYMTRSLAEHDRWVKVCPGTPGIVLDLHKRGVPMAIVTSKRLCATEIGLRFLGLLEPSRFEAVVCADHVSKPKPEPEPVLLALEKLGVPASRAVFIGDTVHDIAAGRAAGVTTVAVTWGAGTPADLRDARPDHYVTTAAELSQALGL